MQEKKYKFKCLKTYYGLVAGKTYSVDTYQINMGTPQGDLKFALVDLEKEGIIKILNNEES